MGTFGGHLLPGAAFYFTGVWNLVNCLRILVAGAPFLHKFWYPVNIRCTQKPVEPLLKIILCFSGILVEMGHSAQWSLHDTEGNYIHMNDLQHSTMYASFIIASIVDILVEQNSKLYGLDGLCYFFGFAGEAFLIYFHLEGRMMVDAQIHTCLVAACLLCAVTALLARWKSTNPIISIAYSLSVMLHGTWFIQAGFLLYPPGHEDIPALDLMDMGAMMYVTDLFVMHLLALLVIILAFYFLLKIVTPTAKPQKHYVKHQKYEPESPMYKTVPSSVHFYVDSD